jgi:hypothetical protein
MEYSHVIKFEPNKKAYRICKDEMQVVQKKLSLKKPYCERNILFESSFKCDVSSPIIRFLLEAIICKYMFKSGQRSDNQHTEIKIGARNVVSMSCHGLCKLATGHQSQNGERY